jgi:hypothetical protein
MMDSDEEDDRIRDLSQELADLAEPLEIQRLYQSFFVLVPETRTDSVGRAYRLFQTKLLGFLYEVCDLDNWVLSYRSKDWLHKEKQTAGKAAFNTQLDLMYNFVGTHEYWSWKAFTHGSKFTHSTHQLLTLTSLQFQRSLPRVFCLMNELDQLGLCSSQLWIPLWLCVRQVERRVNS